MNVESNVLNASLRFTNEESKTVGAYRRARTDLTNIQVGRFKEGIALIRKEPVQDAFLTITTELKSA